MVSLDPSDYVRKCLIFENSIRLLNSPKLSGKGGESSGIQSSDCFPQFSDHTLYARYLGSQESKTLLDDPSQVLLISPKLLCAIFFFYVTFFYERNVNY